ncbi:MAG: DNA cytosine methyltransferase [Rickettsiales bacterium]|jgi:DNA (cytosine-5)-methyltransferase 1|nr:DNA cytosine methyltransferase [Rickettsiales bacterium]
MQFRWIFILQFCMIKMRGKKMHSIEICAGAGGQAIGLEQAGFSHDALVEIEKLACDTLRVNRPQWNVIEADLHNWSAKKYYGVDLFAGGVPCPPFSVAGKQKGKDDERDLFPTALRLISECNPKAVLLENVKGLFSPKFSEYREQIKSQLESMGYICFWNLIQVSNYGLPQLRPRTILIALKKQYAKHFMWPLGLVAPPPTIGDLLKEEMASNGWMGAEEWARSADGIAPTLVGGSKKHGGADLGPTRARQAWAKLGVDGMGIADKSPDKGFVGMPRLTIRMAALVQGFPKNWQFSGKKTPAYRQIGNAFPPPAAKAMGKAILKALIAGAELEQEDFTNGKIRVAG